jgi:hypothetical protein
MTTTSDFETALGEIRALLRSDDITRVEFSIAFGMDGSVQTAQVYKREQVGKKYGQGWTNKWVKVGPFLTTTEGTREALFTLLATLSKTDE